MPLMRAQAREALDTCINAPDLGPFHLKGSNHFSNAGRVAGEGKASAPLRFLHLAAQALHTDDEDNDSGSLHPGVKPLFLRMAAAARASLSLSASPHAYWVQFVVDNDAAEHIARYTEDDDDAANRLIVQKAAEYALAQALGAEVLMLQLNAALDTYAVDAGPTTKGTLCGFDEVRHFADKFSTFTEAGKTAAAAVSAVSNPPHQLPQQEQPLGQLAALLGQLRHKGTTLRLHSSGAIYYKMVEYQHNDGVFRLHGAGPSSDPISWSSFSSTSSSSSSYPHPRRRAGRAVQGWPQHVPTPPHPRHPLQPPWPRHPPPLRPSPPVPRTLRQGLSQASVAATLLLPPRRPPPRPLRRRLLKIQVLPLQPRPVAVSSTRARMDLRIRTSRRPQRLARGSVTH